MAFVKSNGPPSIEDTSSLFYMHNTQPRHSHNPRMKRDHLEI